MQYLDDYQPGQRFVTAARVMSEDAAKDFATAFDPQPFHLDADAAARSTFGKLVVSGWHTSALTMRLMVDSDFQPINGIIGFRVDELNWHKPVAPGDRLHVVMEVLAVT
ncbi:MAG: MaoC/PaaZ C-terminal domain-containing protein, partial [Rhodospirillales bacterium]